MCRRTATSSRALTVEQNLVLGVKAGRKATRWSMEDTYQLFPVLRERRDAPAGVLSGGEQQMLTICRTLMGDPDLIMIDEPTEGLAPQVVERIAELLQPYRRARHFDPAGRAEADDRAAHFASSLCHGSRAYRIRGEPGGAPRKPLYKASVARSLIQVARCDTHYARKRRVSVARGNARVPPPGPSRRSLRCAPKTAKQT